MKLKYSDENVVTVDANGKLTAVADGSAYVIVATSDGKYAQWVDVFVSTIQ